MTNIPVMDWVQVALNGGPPCFAVNVDNRENAFCGRAKRWCGHDGTDHEYVSLEQYVERVLDEHKDRS